MNRALHVGFALSFIFALIASLLISSFISAALESEARQFASIINIIVSFFFYIGLFTFTFRYLPDRNQAWGVSLNGGTLTAFMFVVGKEVIGAYLGNSAIGSAYGAAGSIIVLLVWVLLLHINYFYRSTGQLLARKERLTA